MTSIEAEGLRVKETESEELYLEYKPVEVSPVKLTFVPYFAWNNRGEGEMTVWLQVFLQNVELKIIKVDIFNKRLFIEARFRASFKFADIAFKPDGTL